jgi:heptosyltransferase-1
MVGQGLIDRWYRVATGEWKKKPLARGTRSDIFALRKVLHADRFDVCVDLQGSLKSAVVGRMAGATVFVGPAEPRERIARRMYDQRVEITAAHVVSRGCQLLGAAVSEGLKPARVSLPMDTGAEQWADEVVGGERFCMISPGGGWGAKVWPAARLGAVAAALGRAGVQTVVNAAVNGSSESEGVVAHSEGFARAVPCSIAQLIALERRAGVVIAGDTGPLHLAAALERPVVGIFGPTDPLRNGPFGTRARVLRDASSVTSHKRVEEPEAGMLRIGVDEVVAAALEMLG